MAKEQKTLDRLGTQQVTAGEWSIDSAHTSVEITATHMVVAKVRGHLSGITGKVVIDERPEKSWVEVSISAASIDTGVEMRDDHLRSADFLDVANHPSITFKSTGLGNIKGSSFVINGDLTIRGTTQPIELQTEFLGTTPDPRAGQKTFFTARGEIDREAFGMTWNQALETGGLLVGKKLKFEVDVQLVPAVVRLD